MPSAWLSVMHHKQEFSWSCVAACVRMVLAYHGVYEDENVLCQLLGTTPIGTRGRNVVRIESLGFKVHYGASRLSELQEALADNTPPIVFLRTGRLDYWPADEPHAVVVVGMDSTTVYVNDPAFEVFPQRVSLANFLQAWATTGRLAAIVSALLTSQGANQE